jgi:nucleoprotein TPR
MADAVAEPSQPATSLSDEERQALEEKIEAAEAKAAEFEEKAKELEEQSDAIIKQRSDKMKNALNKRLTESKEAMDKQAQEEKAKLQAEFDLRLQQELAIARAEQMTPAPKNGVPSTPVKAPETQPPHTPAADFSSMNDAQIRDFVATNPTVSSIVKANIKRMVSVESKKAKEEAEAAVKADFEQKIVSAKELVEKKSALRINMLDRASKTAQAKIAVVEAAARETPKKPVVEVWNIAKDAKAPTPPAPAPAAAAAAVIQPTAGSPAAAPAGQPAAGKFSLLESRRMCTGILTISTATPVKEEPSKPAAPAVPAPQSALPQPSKPATGIPTPFAGPPITNNPFGPPAAAPGSNLPQPAAAGQQQPHQGPPQGLPQPPQQHQQQPRGIPVPSTRGGGANRARGVYQAGPGRGGQGPRGRGGYGRGGGGMNPGAGEFNPPGGAGHKRPRDGDGQGEGGRGGKRPRGGGGA